METQDTKGKIVKEAFPSELISIILGIIAGTLLTLLILPFKTFPALILIIPSLITLRGNIGGAFAARTSRDLIIGEFKKRILIENVLATYVLSIISAIFIGILSIFLNLFLLQSIILPFGFFILIPTFTMILSTTFSIPCSTLLNYISFRYGLNPNNIVNPITTGVDDILIVINFYLTLIILGVP